MGSLQELRSRAPVSAIGALALITWTSLSAAQSISPSGVVCGGDEVAFDELGISLDTTSTARTEFVLRLVDHAQAAMVHCAKAALQRAEAKKQAEAQKPTAQTHAPQKPEARPEDGTPALDAAPGCTSLGTLLTLRADQSKQTFKNSAPATHVAVAARRLLVANDGLIMAEARRVLAHKACQSDDASLPRCSALIDAEVRATSQSRATLTAAQTAKLLEGSESAKKLVKEYGLAFGVDSKLDAAFFTALEKTARSCDLPSAANCKPSQAAQASETKSTLEGMAAVRDFYASPVKAAGVGVNVAAAAGPTSAPLRVLVTARDEKVNAAFNEELGQLAGEAEQCREASIYVSPSGTVVTNATLLSAPCPPEDRICIERAKRTICVDASNFAIDRPFEVELSQPRGGQTLRVWPGKAAELPRLTADPVLRVSVRGYPRGSTLRALSRSSSLPLTNSRDAVDLLVLERTIRDERARGETDGVAAKAVDKLRKELAKDKTFQAALKGLVDAVASAKADDAKALTAATDYLSTTTRAAQSAFRESSTSGSAGFGVADQALKAAMPSPPGKALKNAPLLEYLREAELKFGSILDTLDKRAGELKKTAEQASAKEDELRRVLAKICQLTRVAIPFIDEDLLTIASPEARNDPSTSREYYIIDYDYNAGFRQSLGPLWSSQEVFVRVRGVKPGASLGVILDGKGIVQHKASLIGAHDMESAPGDTERTTNTSTIAALSELNPDSPIVQATSTHIIALGHLQGANKYQLTVCSNDAKASACSEALASPPAADKAATAAATAGRTLAKSTVVVHEKHYIGVRAGLGASFTLGPIREAVDVPGLAGTQIVRERNVTTSFALPVLLALYPLGRDVITGPPLASFGITTGADVLKIGETPRLYPIGVVIDFRGFGLSASLLTEAVKTIGAPEGSAVASGTSGETRWRAGVFAGMTMDFDVVEAGLKNYIWPSKTPTVGVAGSK